MLSLALPTLTEEETHMTAVYLNLTNPSISIQDFLENSGISFRHVMEQ